MSSLARIEELEKKFGESPRRFFAPLANEYRKAGDPARAIEMCRAHLEQQPNHMSGQVVLGQALFDGGFKQEAREAFELALTLDPENLIALRHLGDMARESGDFSAAKKWYMQVLDVDSRNHEVMTVLREIDEIINAGTFPTPGRGEPVIVMPESASAAETVSAPEPVIEPEPAEATAPVAEQATLEAERIEVESAPAEESSASEAADFVSAELDQEPVQASAPPDEMFTYEYAAAQVVETETFVTEFVSEDVAESVADIAAEEVVAAEVVVQEVVVEEVEVAEVVVEEVVAEEVAVEEAAVEADETIEEPAQEPVAEFWSAEEPVSPQDDAVAATESPDPFSWFESQPEQSSEQAVIEEEYSAVADSPELFSREEQVEVAPDVADSPEVFSREVKAEHAVAAEAAAELDVAAATHVEEEVDDALAWEADDFAASSGAPAEDGTPAEWVSDFDVVNDPREVELQREIAAGLDWPDNAVEDPAEAGAADMSHMDIVEGGEVEEAQGAIAPTPAVFITETMAQLYEQQGYFEMSAAVYRQLSERNPANDRFRERIAELDRRIAGRTEPPRELKIAAAEEGDSARDFFSSLVRVPLRPRLARPYVSVRSDSEEDMSGASILDAGRPAREASNALSLESVFRNGGTSGRSGSGAAGFSFDQFFVSGGQAPPSGGGTVQPSAARQRKGQDSEEIEQFNSWLEGLKRS